MIPLGILAAQVAGVSVYRLQTLGTTGSESGAGIFADSAGNTYVVGSNPVSGLGTGFLFAKYAPGGIIEWARTLAGANTDVGIGIATDGNADVYVSGRTNSAGAGSNDFLIAKYNSTGTIQWQRVFGGSGDDPGRRIAIDSGNNVYVVGDTNSAGAGSADFLFVKYDSSGTIQFQRVLGGSGFDTGNDIAVDSSDNFYVVGNTQSAGAGGNDVLLAKYNSGGTIQWQRVLGGTEAEQGLGVAVDLDGNVYVSGLTTTTGAGSSDVLLAKYNSSGTLQWQRVLGGTLQEQGNSVAVDSSNNVYVFGVTNSAGAGSNDFLIAKYDSSGTIQWQRVLGGTGNDTGAYIKIDSSDNLNVIGFTNTTGAGSFDFLIGVLPNDGSLTGTYVLNGQNMIYAASTLTAATSSLTGATSSLTSATPSLTSATPSLTSGTPTLIEHRVDL